MHERDTWRSTATDPNGRTLDTRNARSAVFNRGTKDKRAYLHLHCHHSPPLATPNLHLQVTQKQAEDCKQAGSESQTAESVVDALKSID